MAEIVSNLTGMFGSLAVGAVNGASTAVISNLLYDVRMNEYFVLAGFKVPALAVMALSGAVAHVGADMLIMSMGKDDKGIMDHLDDQMSGLYYIGANAGIFLATVNAIGQLHGGGKAQMMAGVLGGLAGITSLYAMSVMDAGSSTTLKTSTLGDQDDEEVFF